jgi:CDP-6-deoxy-D-xylo-4-hexulose-3-dehydrase
MTPVFVDVHLPTYNIDVSALEAAVSPRTRAVMLAHTLGNPFDVRAIRAFCDKYDLYLIEDCCDALGATVNGQPVGTFGDIGTLSFYPAHHITMGEGGAVFTDNLMLAKVMESFRDWGRDCYCKPGCDNTCNNRFGWTLGDLPTGYDHKYVYSHLGFNLKITDMQAAVGLAQLDRLESFISERRRNFATLQDGLQELEEYFILPASIEGADPSWFGYPLTLREGASSTRDELVKALNARRIGTRLLFGGNLVRQPYMKERTFRAPAPLVNADIVVDRTFWIGLYPGLSEPALNYTIETLHDLLRGGMGSRPPDGASVEPSSPALSALSEPNTASGPVEGLMGRTRKILLDPLLARFVTVGVLNTAVGYSLFIAALAVIPSSFGALVASYVLALSFNFWSTGGYVFGSTSPDRLIPFFGAHAFILTFQAIGLRALEGIGMASWAAGLLLLPAAVVMSFILSRYVVFGRRP